MLENQHATTGTISRGAFRVELDSASQHSCCAAMPCRAATNLQTQRSLHRPHTPLTWRTSHLPSAHCKPRVHACDARRLWPTMLSHACVLTSSSLMRAV